MTDNNVGGGECGELRQYYRGSSVIVVQINLTLFAVSYDLYAEGKQCPTPKPSAGMIPHGVGMMHMHLVWAPRVHT